MRQLLSRLLDRRPPKGALTKAFYGNLAPLRVGKISSETPGLQISDSRSFFPCNTLTDHHLRVHVAQERKRFELALESMSKSECVDVARSSNHECLNAKRRSDLEAVLKHTLTRYACMSAARKKGE